MWILEKEQIARTLEGTLYDRMNDTGIFLNLKMVTPYKDKRSRARAIQARMRAGGVYFDKEAEWYPAFEQELIQFPKGRFKDQVDAFAWLGIAINEMAEGMTTKEKLEDDIETQIAEFEYEQPRGRSAITGY
jgi:predicted phage terminase large subunit-like protein